MFPPTCGSPYRAFLSLHLACIGFQHVAPSIEPYIDEVPLNPTTASLVPVPTTSLKVSISRKIRDSYVVPPNNAKSSPRRVSDLPIQQLDDCICSFFRPDSNRLVNGVKSPYAIRVENGRRVDIRCIDPEMKLVWKSTGMIAEYVQLTCSDCRRYTSNEIPSCQDSQQDEIPFNPTTASSVFYNNATSSPRTVEDISSRQLDHCMCTSFRPDINRLVNGVKSEYGIRVQKGQIAMIRCIDANMDLVWQNGAMTVKSTYLKCNDCRKYESEEIPVC